MRGKRKILALLLALAMVLTFMPTMAFAYNDPENVAEVDGIGYTTMSAAFAAARNGKTLKLLKNVDYQIILNSSSDGLTLDLNGFNIKYDGVPVKVTNGAKLTITNTSSEHPDNTTSHNAVIDESESGTGSIGASGDGTSVLIKAGYFYGFKGNKTAIHAINNATITFEGGVVDGANGSDDWDAITDKEGKVFYAGVNSASNANNETPGNIYVKGGLFRGRMSNSNWGNYHVSGGTFDRNKVVCYHNPTDEHGNPTGTSTNPKNDTCTLEKSGWLVDGYTVVKESDGKYSVVVDEEVAASVKKDGVVTNYRTVSEAVEAADELDTLTIKKAAEGEAITTDKNINIKNESGNKISVNGKAVESGKSVNTNEGTADTAKEKAEADKKTAEAAKTEAEKTKAAMAVRTITVNEATVDAAAIDKAVAKAGGDKKYVKTIKLGKKVKKIKKAAFKNYSNATLLIVQSKKLKKSAVKKSLTGSKVTNIRISLGSNKLNLKYLNKYKKFFTKKNAGKKVKLYYNATY